MEAICWIILCFVVEGQADVLYSKYIRNPAFDNMLPSGNQLWSVHSRSQTECCVICQTDSKCLSYFYKLQQCTGFPYRMTSYVGINAVPGAIYADMEVVDSLFVALLRGNWRDKIWLMESSHDDRRNTLIVEMAKHCGIGGLVIGRPDYGFSGSLSGMAAIYICLRDNNVDTHENIIALTDVEQRQSLITFLGGSASLLSLSDHNLASNCY